MIEIRFKPGRCVSSATPLQRLVCVCVTVRSSLNLVFRSALLVLITPSVSTAIIGRKNVWACKLSSGSEVMRLCLPNDTGAMPSKPVAAAHRSLSELITNVPRALLRSLHYNRQRVAAPTNAAAATSAVLWTASTHLAANFCSNNGCCGKL